MAREHKHVSIDAYAYQSGMRDYNAAYKVFFSLGALIVVIAADSLYVSAATVCYMLFLTVALGKVHLHDYIRLMLVPAAFIVLSGLAIALQTGEVADAVWSVSVAGKRLGVGHEGLALAARTGIKAFGAVSALYLMTLSTPMGEILTVLRKLHIPDLIIELMHLIYRYIFTLLEQNRRQKDAAAARFGYVDFRTSLRTFGMELANLFVLSMKKSGVYYDAMESRGYEGRCLFWEERKTFTLTQFLPCLGYLVIVAGILIYDG